MQYEATYTTLRAARLNMRGNMYLSVYRVIAALG